MNSTNQLSILVVFIILIIPYSVFGQGFREKFDIADSLTVRLQPADFDQLPPNIVRYLEENNYTIPQCGCESEPHNIVSGNFGRTLETDWAVLASKNRISRIIVFWEGATDTISTIAKRADRSYLQNGVDGIKFSRMISTAGKSSILIGYKNWGGVEPPTTIDHLGIENIFAYKASTIHYHFDDQWMELSGSD